MLDASIGATNKPCIVSFRCSDTKDRLSPKIPEKTMMIQTAPGITAFVVLFAGSKAKLKY